MMGYETMKVLIKSYLSHFLHFNTNNIAHKIDKKNCVRQQQHLNTKSNHRSIVRTCNNYDTFIGTCGKRKQAINTRTSATTIVLMTFVFHRMMLWRVRLDL